MAIAEMHLVILKGVHPTRAVDAACFNQDIFGFPTIGAPVHAQGSTDRAWNTAEKCNAGDCRLMRGPADFHIRRRRPGANPAFPLNRDLTETAAQPNDDARHPAVAHNQIGAKPDYDDWNLTGQVCKERRQVGFVFRQEQHLRRSTDAKPGEFGERLVGNQPTANCRHARLEACNGLLFDHAASKRQASLTPRLRVRQVPPVARTPIA